MNMLLSHLLLAFSLSSRSLSLSRHHHHHQLLSECLDSLLISSCLLSSLHRTHQTDLCVWMCVYVKTVVVIAEITSTSSKFSLVGPMNQKKGVISIDISRESRHSDSSWWWWWCLEEKATEKKEKKPATDETATCSSDVAFIINHLHNDPIILCSCWYYGLDWISTISCRRGSHIHW